MRKKLKKRIDKWFMPRWLVLFADLSIVVTTFFFTYFLRFNLASQYVDVPEVIFQLLCGMPFFILAAVIFRPFEGILRHSSLNDVFTLVKAHLLLSFGFFLESYFGRLFHVALNIPYSVIIVHYFVSVFVMIIMRLLVLFAYRTLVNSSVNSVNVMIYGAGKLGDIARNVILKDDKIKYKIVGYIDDNPNLWHSRLGGVKIYPPEKAFSRHVRALNVKEIILAISQSKIEVSKKREIVDACLTFRLKVREVTDPENLLNGKFKGDRIRDIRIEDLLGREPISLNVESVTKGIEGKRVMITGGAGSIGSEIVRQLVHLNPQMIIIVDQAESALFDIQQEIMSFLKDTELKIYVADVTDQFMMRKIFNTCYPEIIYHAAAYKHVPLMEIQPYEAVYNNVGGTKNLADLAVEFEVRKFVMVSTDKAVNPTNIMGTTKRICEVYIQSLSQQKEMKTQFITTRFGNVLGSNGSVIPLFKKQIALGGPVTLTHKDIIRYFMTIPEACQLVMEAGFLGHGGEIFLFDMGEPIRIYDLAIKMISLSGLIPHKDIEIREIGLRPGEKLYEELLADKEDTLPTEHSKIMKAKIRPYPYAHSLKMINQLLNELIVLDDLEIVMQMKKIVPEFISNNSRFEILDNRP